MLVQISIKALNQGFDEDEGVSAMGVANRWRCDSHLDEVDYKLVLVLGCGHLIVGDGLPKCLLGNEGVQVEDGGQAAVKADELFFVGVEMD